MPARAAHGDRHPLRDAAARGRLAARRIVEADDDGLYVVKFRGAGQGPKALVAEIVAGELARALGLPVPELVLVELDPRARRRPSPTREIQDLLAASRRASTSASTSCPARCRTRPTRPAGRRSSRPTSCGSTRSCTNVDRTPRNPNLLRWHGGPVADRPRRGALRPSTARDPLARARGAFPADPRPRAAARAPGRSVDADARLAAARVDRRGLAAIAALVPAGRGPTTARLRRATSRRGSRRRARSSRRPSVPEPRSRSSTPSCGWCRASSAASPSTPASCCSAARALPRPRARSSTRPLLARAGPATATRRDGARAPADLEADRRRRRGRRADRRAAAVRALPLAVAPSSHDRPAGPVHTGLTADPAGELDRLFGVLVSRP